MSNEIERKRKNIVLYDRFVITPKIQTGEKVFIKEEFTCLKHK